MRPSGEARLAGIFGWPIGHSRSPQLHGYWLDHYGIDGAYVPLAVRPEDFPAAVRALPQLGFVGANVTVPHKEAAERCVARKTDVCARVGACNTFWTEHGALVGDNTDVAGILAALRQLGADGAGSWLLVGTGGAARAGVEPHGGSRQGEPRRPLGAQPAAPEHRLGLPAAGAPRGTHGAPAVTAHVAHQPGGIAERKEGAAQQALGREEELLDGLTHQGRGSRRHASPRAAPPHPGRSG